MKDKKTLSLKKSIFKIIVMCLMILIVCIIGYLICKHFNLTSMKKDDLQDLIAGFGAYGPLIFILITFLQVTFIPIPSVITILAGSYLFGPITSYFYSFIGMLLGSLFAFFLGRKIGKKFVNWIVGDKETVDYYLGKLKGRETVVLFFMFLLPFFPDDALCAIAGILPVSLFTFTIMQVITRITSIGATLLFMSGTVIPYHGWGLIILIILGILSVVAFIIAYKNSQKINDKIINISQSITNFFKKIKYRKNGNIDKSK